MAAEGFPNAFRLFLHLLMSSLFSYIVGLQEKNKLVFHQFLSYPKHNTSHHSRCSSSAQALLLKKRCVTQTQCCLQALMAALPVHPWQFGGLGSLSNGVTGLCFFDATQPVMLLLSTMASATALRISRDIRHSSAF